VVYTTQGTVPVGEGEHWLRPVTEVIWIKKTVIELLISDPLESYVSLVVYTTLSKKYPLTSTFSYRTQQREIIGSKIQKPHKFHDQKKRSCSVQSQNKSCMIRYLYSTLRLNMKPPSFLYLSPLFFACSNTEKEIEPSTEEVLIDADGDGFFTGEDCDDNNPLISQEAEESCDGVDNNCDGSIDEGVLNTYYADSDADGYGNPSIATETCEIPQGFVENGSDCDDTNALSYPSAEESCDGLDNNCNGSIDEGLEEEFYIDADGDGFGDETQLVEACLLAPGLATIGGDCADDDPSVNPFKEEDCDNIDNNCDGNIDEGVLVVYYEDKDADGYGEETSSIESCTQPEGFVAVGQDCDDLETYAHPYAIEICDGIDNDCDSSIDEAGSIDEQTFYLDTDGDGFGDPSSPIDSCTQPSTYVDNDQDCDDDDATVSPTVDEICDGIDNDCDGETDGSDSIDQQVWYADNDTDGYGDIAQPSIACDAPLNYVSQVGDCDDTLQSVHPTATEICNGIDEDCNGIIDDEAQDATIYFADYDNDGFGNPNNTIQDCNLPPYYTTDDNDCDDNDDDVFPEAVEICNSEDDNCDGDIDEGMTTFLWYLDDDGDGFGDANTSIESCEAPTNYVENSQDCDDDDGSNVQWGTSDCPGTSCSELLSLGITSSGTHWIDPTGAHPIAAYCDMSFDGGGWTLVVKYSMNGVPTDANATNESDMASQSMNGIAKLADTDINAIDWTTWRIEGVGDSSRHLYNNNGVKFDVQWGTNYTSLSSGTTTNGRNQEWCYYNTPSYGVQCSTVTDTNTHSVSPHEGSQGGHWIHINSTSTSSTGGFSCGYNSSAESNCTNTSLLSIRAWVR
jgi:hypothetical protein